MQETEKGFLFLNQVAVVFLFYTAASLSVVRRACHPVATDFLFVPKKIIPSLPNLVLRVLSDTSSGSKHS